MDGPPGDHEGSPPTASDDKPLADDADLAECESEWWWKQRVSLEQRTPAVARAVVRRGYK